MIQFFQTGMGHRFFGAQLPDLILQIKRVANALEDIAETLRAGTERRTENTAKNGTLE